MRVLRSQSRPVSRAESLFGTDGIRGIPGRYPLISPVMRRLGFVIGRLLPRNSGFHLNGSTPKIVMVRDTRSSGASIARELSEGLSSAGAAALDCGILPTPSVSYLIQQVKAAGGISVSASHNPAEFNGVKVFDGLGRKIAPELERRIEADLEKAPGPRIFPAAAWVKSESALPDLYLDFLRSAFPAMETLGGVRLAVDSAHGASFKIARSFFESLGARVDSIGDRPDGKNINAGCGALDLSALKKLVKARKADVGVAFDGDADRAIFCDEKGAVKDGDFVLAAAALRMKRLGLLKNDAVVVTTMSNLGLRLFLEKRGIGVVVADVGDRNVAEALERDGLSLGGEPSGHVIFKPFLETGDGLLTAGLTLAAFRESKRPFSKLVQGLELFPQIIKNAPAPSQIALARLPRFQAEMARRRNAFKGRGRLIVRYSGTEPLLRIMIEGRDLSKIKRAAEALADLYQNESKEFFHATRKRR